MFLEVADDCCCSGIGQTCVDGFRSFRRGSRTYADALDGHCGVSVTEIDFVHKLLQTLVVFLVTRIEI